jgi:8-oxo-dGTP pyrophosphatase MutT (NUDIX family)
MFAGLPVEVQEELTELAQRFGQPVIQVAQIDTERLFDPLNRADRYGEVCMVVRRRNGRLLTSKKTFYPADAYRLLTGGINHGEKVLSALLRETHEETALDVVVRRFLAAVAYALPGQTQQPIFYTFAFLLDEVGGVLESLDAQEHVEFFRELAPAELPARADFLAHLTGQSPEQFTSWRDWGQFRAVIHRLVWQALSE